MKRLFIVLFFLGAVGINAQVDTVKKKDTVIVEQKQPTKFKKFLQKFIIKNKKTSPTLKKMNYRGDQAFQGKIIRNIYYETNDPFGYSLSDSTKRPTKWLEKVGNAAHIKSRNMVLRQNILFKEGNTYDSLVISESERLIRSSRAIRQVKIENRLVGNDSVDVYINSIDSWSMLVTGAVTSSRAEIRLSERNFLGLAHAFNNRYRHNYKTGRIFYHFNYTVPNIAKTRIQANVDYLKNESNFYNKSINFVRPFYSPLSRYAGGVSVSQNFFRDSTDFDNSHRAYSEFKYNDQDYWLARAFRIDRSHTKNITNFIVSARFNHRDYIEKPTPLNDPINFFSNQANYFLAFGISSQRYVKTKYIYNYGIDEDVATGKSFGIITSKQRIRGGNRFYTGSQISMGRFIKSNFYAFRTEFGGFFNKRKFEQKTLSFELQSMLKLSSLGNWKYRNFFKMNYLLGYDRLNSSADQLSLNQSDYLGMAGFGSDRSLLGEQKFIFDYQFQTYSPFQFLGFRISPFFNTSISSIGGNDKFIFNKNPIYSRFSVGVMLTNDYFVFGNFHLSFSFYPNIPGQGQNILKTNVINNRDFQLMNFNFSKPSYTRWNRWD